MDLTFEDLVKHLGHHLKVVTYGDPPYCAEVICEDCAEGLFGSDRYEEPADPREV